MPRECEGCGAIVNTAGVYCLTCWQRVLEMEAAGYLQALPKGRRWPAVFDDRRGRKGTTSTFGNRQESSEDDYGHDARPN